MRQEEIYSKSNNNKKYNTLHDKPEYTKNYKFRKK